MFKVSDAGNHEKLEQEFDELLDEYVQKRMQEHLVVLRKMKGHRANQNAHHELDQVEFTFDENN